MVEKDAKDLKNLNDVMHLGTKLPLAKLDEKMSKALITMTKKSFGCIGVINKNQQIVGIITDGDLRRALEKYNPSEWENLLANDFMTHNPIKIFKDELASSALSLMEKNNQKPISILVVVDESESVIGMLRMHEIVQSGLKN